MTSALLPICVLSNLLLALASPAPAQDPEPKKPTPKRMVVKQLSGFTVHVDPALLEGPHSKTGTHALRMLENHLERISLLVQGDRLGQLRQARIWVEHEHPKLRTMQYHVSKNWLIKNGHDPRLAKMVHIPRARDLVSRAQIIKHPAVVLHELAHAFHDQQLGFNDPRIREAYEAAKAKGNYEKVLAHNGQTVKHYALTNRMEYFAEATEAYFYRNDFYPFVRAELEKHDPKMHALLVEIWGPAR
ncbi:MAG: metallopeptidase [Planctomycetota bacterium]|nr:metallopeptidase [Planctomycetota bacterium]